jgi:hypothetical protein
MILDHVRFTPTFLGGQRSQDTWVMAIVHESDEGVTVHKLLTHELRQALATPEVLKRFSSGPEGYPLSHVSAMAQRIEELQAIVDKRDDRQWDPIIELFHPDMNVSNIQAAIRALFNVLAEVHRIRVGTSTQLSPKDYEHLRRRVSECFSLLWEKVPTQLEKDEVLRLAQDVRDAAEQDDAEQRAPERDIALTDALERGAIRGQTAERLWDLLDSIDTLSDQLKPDHFPGYRKFYEMALDITKKRHEYLKSDGNKLTWSSEVMDAMRTKYQDLAEAVVLAVGGYVWNSAYPENASIVRGISELFDRVHVATAPPVPMLLHCPMCGERHIDEGEFATKEHHTHACQGFVVKDGKKRRCGHVWRPAIVATVGVEALPGFVNAPGDTLVGRRVQLSGGSTGEIMDHTEGIYRVVGVGSSGTCGEQYLRRSDFTVIDEPYVAATPSGFARMAPKR